MKDLEVRSSWNICVEPIDLMTGVLIREEQGEFCDRHTGGGHVRTEAETRAVWPQAKGHPEPPRAGSHRKDASLEPLREPTP